MAETSTDTVMVFDTWGDGKQGRLHFDVMTTDEATALKLAKRHLENIGESGAWSPRKNVSSVTVNRWRSSQPNSSGNSKNTAASS